LGASPIVLDVALPVASLARTIVASASRVATVRSFVHARAFAIGADPSRRLYRLPIHLTQYSDGHACKGSLRWEVPSRGQGRSQCAHGQGAKGSMAGRCPLPHEPRGTPGAISKALESPLDQHCPRPTVRAVRAYNSVKGKALLFDEPSVLAKEPGAGPSRIKARASGKSRFSRATFSESSAMSESMMMNGTP
jgi:hypothetical protein